MKPTAIDGINNRLDQLLDMLKAVNEGALHAAFVQGMLQGILIAAVTILILLALKGKQS
jgi:hypothetical protein